MRDGSGFGSAGAVPLPASIVMALSVAHAVNANAHVSVVRCVKSLMVGRCMGHSCSWCRRPPSPCLVELRIDDGAARLAAA
jgi:hypothetical protein